MFQLNDIRSKITPFEKELLAELPSAKFVHGPWEIKKDRLCGYSPRKHQILFTCDRPRISHEIAHMVEINNLNRLIIDDWGLSFESNFSSNTSKFSQSKFAFCAAARECRVKAIESFLCKSQYQHERVLSDNWYLALYSKIQFGRFKKTSDVDEWLRNIFEKTKTQWSLDRIKSEWNARAIYIRHWQNSY